MSIEQLVANYHPDQIGIDVVNQSRAVFLAGIMSAGKDALRDELLKSPDYYDVITHTTRPIRMNSGEIEHDGVNYHFVTSEQMSKLLEEHKMIEINHFGNNYYGTSVEEFRKANEQGLVVLENIDIHGVSSMYDIAPQNMTAIFVVPPSYETWIKRIVGRYGSVDSFNNEWQNRREITILELKNALNVPYYHFVINDDLNSAVEQINNIAHSSDSSANYDDHTARACAVNLLHAIRQMP